MIHLNIPKAYTFAGVNFEMTYCGPWPIKRNGDPKKRAGRRFYRRIEDWIAMSDADREIYRTGGGNVFSTL